jgi:hypothetical protein
MAESVPDLIIPIRMDPSKATAVLVKVGAEAKKAGKELAQGAAKAEGGLKGVGNAAGEFGRQTVANHGAHLAFSAVGAAISAMSSQFKAAVDYITNISKEFVELRQAMQQVAALNGEAYTNQFTVAEAMKAAAANLTPQEWRAFQEQFQSFGGAHIEDDLARFVRQETNEEFEKRAEAHATKSGMTKGQAMTMLQKQTIASTEQADEYQQKIAEFGKARGIPAAEIAQLGGALLQFSEGPQTPEQMMEQLGKVYHTLERARTPVSQLMPQMPCVMAQGASAEEAAQMLAIMSEAMAGEEETGVTNTINAITNQVLERKGKGLGQKEEMSRLEQVKAAVAAIKARQEKGEGLDAILKEVAPELPEMPRLKGFLTRGLEAQGFEWTRGYQEETPVGFVQQSIEEYKKTGAGRRDAAQAARALAEARAATRNAELQTLQEAATARMTERGEFEEFRLGKSAVRGATGKLTGVDVRQQRTNAEMLIEVARRAAEAGVEDKSLYNPNTALGRANIATDSTLEDQFTINKRLLDMLEKIDKNTRQQTEKDKAGKPISAPPPGGGGIRQ